jgi:hypothetical protein
MDMQQSPPARQSVRVALPLNLETNGSLKGSVVPDAGSVFFGDDWLLHAPM